MLQYSYIFRPILGEGSTAIVFLNIILSSIFKIPNRFIFDSRYLDSLYDKLYDAVVDYRDYLNFYYALYKEFGENESLKNVSGLIKEIGRY